VKSSNPSPNPPGALSLLLGTGFYSGLLPFAPGTAGSLAAMPFIYATALWLGPAGVVGFLFLWILISMLTAPSFERFYGEDPSRFVADEWAGQAVPFIGISFVGNLAEEWWILLLGFLLFRLFDIFKPLGIKRAEKLGAGTGILADDLLAGIYALIILKFVILLA